MKTINFEGIDYPSHLLRVYSKATGTIDITIATETLQNKLIFMHTDEPVSDEAEAIDNGIYFYVPDEAFDLPVGMICAEHLDEPFFLIEEL